MLNSGIGGNLWDSDGIQVIVNTKIIVLNTIVNIKYNKFENLIDNT